MPDLVMQFGYFPNERKPVFFPSPSPRERRFSANKYHLVAALLRYNYEDVMKTQDNKIKCPKCGTEIDVNAILYHQLEEDFQKQFNLQLTEEKQKFARQAAELEKEKERLEKEKQAIEKQIQEEVQKTLKSEKHKLEKELTEKIKEEQNEQVKALEKELTEKSAQLKEFNKAKADIARLQREKDELKEAIEAEAQKKLNDTLKIEKEKIRKTEEERMSLKVSEKEQIIDQLKRQLQEAQRKADQSSTQLQGEVQELAIEDWLAASFPLDTISEIKKGARGGDCLQTVNTRTRQNCGCIYYESKRTKDFQPSWIEKFKTDMRNKGANIGVIVTDARPKDMERMGQKDGVWICSFDEFKGLCFVLRESVIQISNAIATQENKGDKMTLLYDYLTSNEFKLQIEAIVEGFSQMNMDLETEKRAMQGIWKKREKQIQKVLLNTSFMYSSIKGIAGNAVQPIKMLELPEGGEVE
jgi:hypothetical protein